MNPAKLRDGAKIRLVARCQHSEPDVLNQPLLKPSRREHTHAIAVDQNLCHHARMIRRIAPLLTLVVRLDRSQVQLIDQIGNEIRQMVLAKPLPQARRKKKILFREIRPVALRHSQSFASSSNPFNQHVWNRGDYSDTLLGKV